jgi:hypothetical protein
MRNPFYFAALFHPQHCFLFDFGLIALKYAGSLCHWNKGGLFRLRAPKERKRRERMQVMVPSWERTHNEK